MARAVPRREEACVVCARRDWIDHRYQVYLFREADGSTNRFPGSVQRELCTNSGVLCFGPAAAIDTLLKVERYMEAMPLIPPSELYASAVVHPVLRDRAWLLHTRRVPKLAEAAPRVVPRFPSRGSARSVQASDAPDVAPDQAEPGSAARAVPSAGNAEAAEAAPGPYRCSGIGDPDATAWICSDCAVCLCRRSAQVCMPGPSLANLNWLGRLPPLFQDLNLGTKMLLGRGRACYRKLVLGRGDPVDLQRGLTGNTILLSQGRPSVSSAQGGACLPPTSEELAESFVVAFSRGHEADVAKAQILTVERHKYIACAKYRQEVCPAFQEVRLDLAACAALPSSGVPQQLQDCAVPMDYAEDFEPTRPGPASRRCCTHDSRADDTKLRDEFEVFVSLFRASLPSQMHLDSFT